MLKIKRFKLYLSIFITIIVLATIFCLNAFNVFGKGTGKIVMGVPYDLLPPDKQQAMDIQEKSLSDAASKPPASKNPNKTSFYDVGVPISSGLIGFIPDDQVSKPVSSQDYITTSAWVGNINGIGIEIISGYKTKNPKQGVVIVIKAQEKQPIKVYSTKGPDGALYLVSLNGSVFTLSTVPSDVNPSCYCDVITQQIANYSGVSPIYYTFDVATNTFAKLNPTFGKND